MCDMFVLCMFLENHMTRHWCFGGYGMAFRGELSSTKSTRTQGTAGATHISAKANNSKIKPISTQEQQSSTVHGDSESTPLTTSDEVEKK